jgi:hypothetical protein
VREIYLLEQSQWLKGGPFLEVSFLLEHKEQQIKDILNKLTELNIEIVDKSLTEIINDYETGYPFDDDPHSVILHSLHIRLYVNFLGKRKAELQIEKVSSNSILVNFLFYGDEKDALELGQVGIKENDLKEFKTFLSKLFEVYKYKVGGIAIERYVLDLFESNETYPSEVYRYETLNPAKILKRQELFIALIWNEDFGELNGLVNNYKRVKNQGVLIEKECL